MENQFRLKLMDSIAAENTYILIAAILMAAVLGTIALFAWLYRHERKERGKHVSLYYMILRVLYELFQTGITIFPLLGMYGTVKALLSLDFANELAAAQLRFFDALTSTAWGIIFAVIFKLVNAVIAPLLDRLMHTEKHSPEKKGERK